MKWLETTIEGAFILQPHLKEDSRGFFGRLFCASLFQERGINPRIAQINNSLSKQQGTLRGLHYQVAPYAETKLVRCTQGAVWDVVLDVREKSPTFGQWFGQELNAENRWMMYVPQGCAHGFISLSDQAEVIYFVSEFYSPEHERGYGGMIQSLGSNGPPHPRKCRKKIFHILIMV